MYMSLQTLLGSNSVRLHPTLVKPQQGTYLGLHCCPAHKYHTRIEAADSDKHQTFCTTVLITATTGLPMNVQVTYFFNSWPEDS